MASATPLIGASTRATSATLPATPAARAAAGAKKNWPPQAQRSEQVYRDVLS